MAAYGEGFITQAEFWIVLWGCSLWFIVQRLIMVFAFCKVYKVKPIAKEDLPSLKETFKKGWQGAPASYHHPASVCLRLLLQVHFLYGQAW